NTDPYKVQVGIDQGEVISPLLWVIYIDPLLTVLNEVNRLPYTISSSDYSVAFSTLAFMDDTTLLSSDITGIEHMLDVAQEFYQMNNTKINFNKADLICNRNPNDPSKKLSTVPSPYSFNVAPTSFSLTPLAPSASFRFLGVWFTISSSSAFVKKQCKTEYALFASTLRRKHLTIDQLRYLHNSVLIPRVEYRLKATLLT